MKFITFIATLLLLSYSPFAQKKQQYSRARIYLDDRHTIKQLSGLGLAVDHGEHKRNVYFVSDFSANEITLAKNAGYKVDIVIADVAAYYAQQNKPDKKKEQKTTSLSCSNGPAIAVPSHFHLGSYGGYFTYTEMQQILDSMQLLYPGLISTKQPISTFTTIQGRPIYWLRVSNDPTVDQPAKPQMLVTSVHHAREPGSMSANIFYLWYLLEHYATDPQIKAIIDNTELYFVPCVNPDGYEYNIATNPDGGGMWRKNMRDNGDGTMGIDLNRNYGYEWGYDNVGSSPVTSSEVYRGTAGFSEPETQAIKWFAEHHNFQLNLNYHTFNNDLIYPWGYIASFLTNDSDRFFSYGCFITEHNHYRYGTCDQTLSYITNGDSDDWMYGETTTKNKAYAFTPEIGANEFGFYTPIDNILPDCQANLLANINTAALLLPYATITPTDDNILTTASGRIHYNIKRLGIPDGTNFTVTATPLDSWITLPAAAHTYAGMTLLQEISDSFAYTLSAATPNGQLVSYVLKVNNGLYDLTDTVHFYYGQHYAATTPSTSSLADWVSDGWSLCTNAYYSAPSSLKSNTCAGSYPNSTNASLYTAAEIDLTHSTRAWLRFYSRWGIESNYDYLQVAAMAEGTGVWTPLCGTYTKPGSLSQRHNEPIYDGQQPYWVKEQMDLGDYLGQKIQIKFQLMSDNFNTYEGFYLDDMQVTSIQDGAAAVISLNGEAASVTAYPNPTRNELHINTAGHDFNEPLYAAIYDCLGREMMNFELNHQETTISVKQLPAGVYYLKLTENGSSLPVQKVIVR